MSHIAILPHRVGLGVKSILEGNLWHPERGWKVLLDLVGLMVVELIMLFAGQVLGRGEYLPRFIPWLNFIL